MTSRRAALLVGLALVAGPAAAFAPSASADGAVLTPGAGTVFDTEASVRLQARVEARSGAAQMRLVDPLGVGRTVDSVEMSFQPQTMEHVLDTACPEYPGSPCSGRRPARNGTWTAQLTGGATDSSSFVLRVPPRAPQAVQAEATGPRSVVVTWDAGAEPDLRGYVVVDGSGDRLAATDTSCPGGTCRTVLAYGSDGPSTEAIAVRAERAVCPDCSDTLDATSSAVTVSRPAPPPAPVPGSDGQTGGGTPAPGGGATPGTSPSGSPAPGGSGAAGNGGTGGPGTGTSGTGSTGTGGRPAGSGSPAAGGAGAPPAGPTVATALPPDDFALTFQAFGPKIGLPKLPPLPAVGVGAAPDVAPVADGTFAPELPFQEQVVEERVPTFVAAPAQRISGAVSAAVDSERLMRSTAAALLLLLVGAHVRRWLAQSPTEG